MDIGNLITYKNSTGTIMTIQDNTLTVALSSGATVTVDASEVSPYCDRDDILKSLVRSAYAQQYKFT